MAKIYSKNPISEVIFKLNFSSLINVEENIDEFHEKIKEKFPFSDIESEPKFSINIKNQEGEIKTSFNPIIWYFFIDEDQNNSPVILEITKDYVLLDFNTSIEKYSGFDDLKEYIILLIDAISVFNIQETNSLGLRYINTIKCNEGNPIKWEGLINNNLLFDSLLDKYDSPSRLMSQFIFEKNNFNINFNFGIFNREFPNPIARKEFILDFDCICQDEISIYNIQNVINEMHDTILELFEENITDKYAKYIMGENNDL